MTGAKTLLLAAAIGLVIGGAATSVFLGGGGDGAPQASAGERSGGGRRGGGRGGRGAFAPTVSMALAQDAAVTKTIDVLGQARALKSVAITAEATGLVEVVNLAPGKRVKEGDILLQMENEAQTISLNRARAQYPIAKANAERYRQLAGENAASAIEAEQAFNTLKNLEADLRSAEFEIEQRTVAAPFDGIVGITTIEAGDYIRAGDEVTTLDDTSSIVVEFAVPQESAAFVELGQPVTARLTSDAGRGFSGEITAIDSRIDSQTRTLRVEATVDNEGGLLLPGAVFTVSTSSDGEPAIAVPGLAVQWDRQGAYVWRRGENGAAERASIVIIQRTDDTVLVKGDIKADDAIAVDGSDRVRIGAPLPEIDARAPSAPGTAGVSAARR